MIENKNIYIEINCNQKNHDGERICGDVFITKRIKEEGRTIAILSDGMGHGVKANMLATLTATMAMNFTQEHKDPERIAEIIMNTLPICSTRKMSYSTFTIIDIEDEGRVHILEYDNPDCYIIRENQLFDPNWQCIILKSEKNKGKEIKTCSFNYQKEDRIVFCSDGIVQSGMGSEKFPFGWQRDHMIAYSLQLMQNDKNISAATLNSKIVNAAVKNDLYQPKDDTSCGSIYFREPRKLLLCTGPPYEKEKDVKLAETFKSFQGKKIISGATTADIISRELDMEITDSFEFHDPDLPPVSFMDGVELITEGILTLSKVSNILKDYSLNTHLGKGPADEIVKQLLNSDYIHLIIGTRINIAHQDPNLPVELEIRRTVVKRIARQLEDKFLKEVEIQYI